MRGKNINDSPSFNTLSKKLKLSIMAFLTTAHPVSSRMYFYLAFFSSQPRLSLQSHFFLHSSLLLFQINFFEKLKFWVFAVLGIEPRATRILGRCAPIKLFPQLF